MLLDTSGLLCLHDRKQPLHAAAREAYASAHVRLTQAYILAEFVALAHARRIPRTDALAFLEALLANPDIEVVWVEEPLNRRGLDLLQARPDKTYSLCDAVSFVLMRERGIGDALTTDRHFQQEGFRRLLQETA
jgi:predicted nucleic acid-binding protein